MIVESLNDYQHVNQLKHLDIHEIRQYLQSLDYAEDLYPVNQRILV